MLPSQHWLYLQLPVKMLVLDHVLGQSQFGAPGYNLSLMIHFTITDGNILKYAFQEYLLKFLFSNYFRVSYSPLPSV